MFDDESWENFRAEALAYVRNAEENLLKKWLNDIGCKEIIIGYYRNTYNNTMEIYSTRPGILIGKAGINVNKLKKMLSEEFHGEWKVKFIEIRGGFVNVD